MHLDFRAESENGTKDTLWEIPFIHGMRRMLVNRRGFSSFGKPHKSQKEFAE